MVASEYSNAVTVPDGISLKDLMLKFLEWYHHLLTKWVVILLCGMLGGILGLVYAAFKKPVFTATTTFVLEERDKGGALGQYAGIASIVGIDMGGGTDGIFQGDNIMELYKSRKMIEKTLLTEAKIGGRSQLLINRYIEFNRLREEWSDQPMLKNISFKELIDLEADDMSMRVRDSILASIVYDINKNFLSVERPDKKLSIIKAEVKSVDESFAKAFNEAIVRNVNDFYIQTKTKKSLENVSILQRKTDSVRAVMNGAIYSAVAIADATPNLNLTRQVQRIAPAQRSQFSAEANRAVLTELVKNLEMSKISLHKETPLIQVIDRPIFPLNKTEIGLLRGILGGSFLATLIVVVLLIARRTLLLIWS